MTTKTGTVGNTVQLTTLLGDFRLLVMLFVGFRLLMMIIYQPLIVEGTERGIGAGGDFMTYFQIAALSDSLGMPFRDWWTEFPPVWSFLSVGVYQLLGENVAYSNFAGFIGFIILIFDTGNLVLMYKLGTRLYGRNTGMALAWIYALLVAPMIFVFWTFEPMVAFFLLLGVWWLLQDKYNHSAVAIALGALTKFTPALLIGALWRFHKERTALQFTGVVLGLFALVYIPLLAQNADMTRPSLTAQFNKASYQTVWALIDGNYRTGNFGPLTDRTDPSRAENILPGLNPATIPGIVRLAVAGAIGLFVFWRTKRFDERGLVAFVGITLMIFFLQAQGWSPQWLVQIIPFVLLTFPTRNGVLVVLLLSFLVFTEYPLLFIRTGDTGGEISGALVGPFTIIVLARTGLLIALAIGFYQRLRQEPVNIQVD
ncbi:MAG: hypothetical protein CUN54_03230 [Phototrophicales bacterium]|nr:MAG: hypothetical protein CUN54_03230 [Phototrophicales bacterium]